MTQITQITRLAQPALGAQASRIVRAAIDQSDELGDKDSADIFTEISRGVDKYLWFVEAHLG